MKEARIVREDFVRVDGGRVDVWLRDDGLYGVTLLPDEGGGTSFTSADEIADFPAAYSESALLIWGRERWARRA